MLSAVPNLCAPAEAVRNQGVVSLVIVRGADRANQRTDTYVFLDVKRVLAFVKPRGVVIGVDYHDDRVHGSRPPRTPAVTCHHGKLVLRHLQQ